MEATASNQRRYLASAAIVFAIAAGAYTVGRVYPPLGPSAGTIAPADRYVEAQIGADDVQLGDTSIPQLMQTDAFEVITKNPDFRNMANSPGFAALLANGPAMAAIAANPSAFNAVAKDPKAFAEMAKVAMQAKSRMVEMQSQSAAMTVAMASHAQSFSYLANKHPQALVSLMANAADLGVIARNPRALDTGALVNVISKGPGGAQAAQQLLADANAMPRIKSDVGMLVAMADHAAAFKGMASNTQLMVASVRQAEMMSRMNLSGRAMGDLASLLSTHAASMNALSAEPKALASMAQHALFYRALADHPAGTQAMLATGMAAKWARDPGLFASNAQNIPQMAAHAADFQKMAADARIVEAMKADPGAAVSMAASAQSLQAMALNAKMFPLAMNAKMLASMASNASMRQVGARPLDLAMAAKAAMTLNALSSVANLAATNAIPTGAAANIADHAQVFAQMANNPGAFQRLAANGAAMSALAANTGLMAKLANVNGAMAMMSNPGFAQALNQMAVTGIRNRD